MGEEIIMLSRDVVIVNGMVRTKDSIRTKDAEFTPIFSEQGYKINKWPSGVFTVETPKYPVITFHNLEDANKALTYQMKKDGVYGVGQRDSKTNYKILNEGSSPDNAKYWIVEEGTRKKVAGPYSDIEVAEKELKKSWNNEDSKTKDDWSPEARKKALEARRAHKKSQPDQPTQQRQPAKQYVYSPDDPIPERRAPGFGPHLARPDGDIAYQYIRWFKQKYGPKWKNYEAFREFLSKKGKSEKYIEERAKDFNIRKPKI